MCVTPAACSSQAHSRSHIMICKLYRLRYLRASQQPAGSSCVQSCAAHSIFHSSCTQCDRLQVEDHYKRSRNRMHCADCGRFMSKQMCSVALWNPHPVSSHGRCIHALSSILLPCQMLVHGYAVSADRMKPIHWWTKLGQDLCSCTQTGLTPPYKGCRRSAVIHAQAEISRATWGTAQPEGHLLCCMEQLEANALPPLVPGDCQITDVCQLCKAFL